MLIKYLGKQVYHGMDGDNHVDVKTGTVVDLTVDKVKQLKADFPKDWEDVKEWKAEEQKLKK